MSGHDARFYVFLTFQWSNMTRNQVSIDMTHPLIRSMLRRFWKQDSGAVTVDWVVLTAAVVVLALSIVTIILGDVSSVANLITDLGSQFLN